jgi:hypothetical protein
MPWVFGRDSLCGSGAALYCCHRGPLLVARGTGPGEGVYGWLASSANALPLACATDAARLLTAWADHGKAVRRHVLFVLSGILR